MFQTFTGAQYLKIDVANNYGLDKKTWNERLAWFDENEHKLDDLMSSADEPALFFAGVNAYRAAKAGGVCTYPIALDATSSGLQILSCLTGDRKAAQLCNVINLPLDFSEEAEAARADGYTIIYHHMVSMAGGAAKIERNDCKDAIMTALYGSVAKPKEVFGEGKLYDIFQETMGTLAPLAWELNKQMLAIWNPKAYMNSWIMPDNFHVNIKVMDAVKENVHFLNKAYEIIRYMNQPTKEGRSLGANSTHSIDGMIVREMVRRCDYNKAQIGRVRNLCLREGFYTPKIDDAYKLVETLWDRYLQSGFLSVRILDYIGEGNINLVDKTIILDIIETLPKKTFKVLPTHDCFRVLPNYGNDVRRQYNHILSDIAKSNMLSFILTQITGRNIQLAKDDSNMWADILDANYSLS